MTIEAMRRSLTGQLSSDSPEGHSMKMLRSHDFAFSGDMLIFPLESAATPSTPPTTTWEPRNRKTGAEHPSGFPEPRNEMMAW